jgi:hypothetical protein
MLQLVAEGKIPESLVPNSPERADELEEKALSGTLTDEEDAELDELWGGKEDTAERQAERMEMWRRIDEYESQKDR